MNNNLNNLKEMLYDRFTDPPLEYGSIPKWIWNINIADISEAEIRRQFAGFKERDGYTGVMIVLWNNDHYLDDVFFEKYGMALKIAKEVGIDVILWDENGFPSGHAGGRMDRLFPRHMAKRLDMVSQAAVSDGKGRCHAKLPGGELVGVVCMETNTLEIRDITDSVEIADDSIECALPEAGQWQLMIFTLATEEPGNLGVSSGRLLDYLSEDAVKAFIDMTHQAYYDRFPEFFGSVIKYAFYDEPSFWHISGGRIWTGDFGKKFKEKHGYDPIELYPALFFDIGENTAAARNILLSFRSELYSECYIKTMQKWCEAHDIKLTGHMDQEEVPSPVSISGDLMKVFEHQDIPGIDQIFKYGRASAAYKIVSSAANNYDKPAVMCEVFGAMGEDMPIENLFREAMDQFAKGVNFMVPHGTWYDDKNNVIFPPELSFRNKRFGPALNEYNNYVKRASALLRGGIHVSDIAVLYPISDLYAYHRFGEGDAYLGGNIAPHVNYMQIGETLSLCIRKDFTYIHPDVLDGRCKIENGELILENKENRESYKIAIIPAMETISISNLKKLRQFASSGGTLICAGRLPSKSAERGGDADVCRIVSELLSCKNSFGRNFCHIPDFSTEKLSAALKDTGIIFDVECEPISVSGGNFTYIHKIKENCDIYFFANSSDEAVCANVRLCGEKTLERWDPHTAKRKKAEYNFGPDGTTSLIVELEPIKSAFFVAQNC